MSPLLALSGHPDGSAALSASLIGRLGQALSGYPPLQCRCRSRARASSLIGRLGQALSGYPPLQCRCRSRARASLRTRHQGPSIMGFEDEVEQSLGRPCRQCDSRFKHPTVFSIGDDPVKLGLVASLNRPSGNATGMYELQSGLEAKRLGLLHDLVPSATTVAVLVNPNNPTAEMSRLEAEEAAAKLGVKPIILTADVDSDFGDALA